MKKILIIFMFALFFIPTICLAEGIDDYYINATIMDNGDLEVEEYFNLTGDFNGFERIINFKNLNTPEFNPYNDTFGGSSIHNGTDIIVEEIRAVSINTNFDFNNISGNIFSMVSNASKGDYGVYTVSNSEIGKTIRIFLPSKKNKAFYIKYKLYDMAILHNDIGELGWNVFGNSLNEDISNLVVNVNVPNNKNSIRVWGHGPLIGETKIISNNKVKATINNLNQNTAIDVRVVFDKEVLFNSNKLTHVDALDKIINYETVLAEEANRKRVTNIENNFYRLEYIPSRENYDIVLNSIYEYNSEDKTEKYLNRLYSYKNKVDEYEYYNFETKILSQEYEDYILAKDYPDKVFNEELKNKMLLELKTVKNKLLSKELLNEFKYLLIAIFSILISYFILRIPKYYSRKIKNVDPKYIRDIPTNISLISTGILIDQKITSYEISAALLDLIRKKIIVLESSDKKNIILKIDDLKYNEANSNDKYLVNMIFENIKKINLKKIKKISELRFKSWKSLFIKELESLGYIVKTEEKSISINMSLLIICILSLFTPFYYFGLFIIMLYSIRRYRQYFIIVLFQIINFIALKNSLFLNHFVHVSFIFNLIAIILLYRYLKKISLKLNIKLTDLGKEERKKLYALRNFLNDFSRLDEKEIPEVSLWEQYLVYATVFGIGDKVLKSMKLKIPDNSILVNMDSIFNSYNMYSDSFSSISSTISSVSKPSINFEISSSSGSSSDWGGSSSSSSGSGGGFSGGSSGGGSFGGGGGGGRF